MKRREDQSSSPLISWRALQPGDCDAESDKLPGDYIIQATINRLLFYIFLSCPYRYLINIYPTENTIDEIKKTVRSGAVIVQSYILVIVRPTNNFVRPFCYNSIFPFVGVNSRGSIASRWSLLPSPLFPAAFHELSVDAEVSLHFHSVALVYTPIVWKLVTSSVGERNL